VSEASGADQEYRNSLPGSDIADGIAVRGEDVDGLRRRDRHARGGRRGHRLRPRSPPAPGHRRGPAPPRRPGRL